ncbi:MAG TPA: hypothetical protein VEL51_01800 [Vicinamibacterales bacterium]|nr:hypothetical protein [Vicinamibacterales bacterium]
MQGERYRYERKTLAELALKVWGVVLLLGGLFLQIDVSSTQLQVLAFAIVGVFVLVGGLQNAVAAGYVLWTKPEQVDTMSYMWERHRLIFTSLIAALLLCLSPAESKTPSLDRCGR